MPVTRRELLRGAIVTALAAACQQVAPAPVPTPTGTVRPAQTPPPATAPPARLLVRAAALADGTSPSALRDAVVLIESGTIAYSGPRDGMPDAAGADVVDLPNATLIPAMVDCHVHLTGTGGRDAHTRLQDPDEVLVARAEENARLLARGGVLGARDVGAVRAANVRARDHIAALEGMPYIAAAGTWIGRTGRYVPFAIQVDSAEELLAAALAQLDAGADLVKIAADGATGSAATFSADELRPTVEAVHARGATVAAHSQGLGARVAAEAGVDTVEHGFVIDGATAVAMREGTTLVTSLSVAAAFGQLEIAMPSVRAARDAGVRIATGTDAGGAPPLFGRFADEVELLVRAGLTPQEALASATRIGGEVMGIPGLGTLDAGATADFVLIDGDPLSDPAALRNVVAVYRAGARLV